MEDLVPARMRYSRHPFAGQTVRVTNGVLIGQLFTIEDWALNLFPIPAHLLADGNDLLYGKIDGHGKMMAAQDLALPLFAVPDPEC